MGRFIVFFTVLCIILTFSAIVAFSLRYNYLKGIKLLHIAEKQIYRKYHVTDVKLEKIGDNQETILTIRKNSYTCIQIAKKENVLKFTNFALAKKQLIAADGYMLSHELHNVQKLLSFCA